NVNSYNRVNLRDWIAGEYVGYDTEDGTLPDSTDEFHIALSGSAEGTGMSWEEGSAVRSGGNGKQFTIAHDMVAAPEHVQITPKTEAAMGEYRVDGDGEAITITYRNAPASGTDNLGWYYRAAL
ncbi:hypothetical protein, partial [Halococcus agarilyticus]|uniref:hypothetical protein n=1 Tax=Halococcus agarilyticus TaxID=1232219 RepID=UPI0018966E73